MLGLESQLLQAQSYHAMMAISCVHQELVKKKGPPLDEFLLAVITMSGHGEVVDDDILVCQSLCPCSPLVRANRADEFAKLLIIPAHSQALANLMQKKGGLHITLPGFPALLCLIDVLQASIKGPQPQLPFVGSQSH